MYTTNRRKFLVYLDVDVALMLPSCSTVPITDRKQLSIIPEYKINAQAAVSAIKSKAKLITKGSQQRVRE